MAKPGRQPPPPGFDGRMAEIRVSPLGPSGPRTTRVEMARAMKVKPGRYLSWENDNRFPGRAVLEVGFSWLPAVQEFGIDPRVLARWAETGAGPRPWRLEGTTPPGSGGGAPRPRSAERIEPAMPVSMVEDARAHLKALVVQGGNLDVRILKAYTALEDFVKELRKCGGPGSTVLSARSA